MITEEQISSKKFKMSPTQVYEMAEKRLNELKAIEKQKSIAIQKYPAGRIHVIKTRGRTQFYLRTDPKDKSGKYIQKGEEATIKKYLQKAYDEKIYKLITLEIKSIEAFLNHSKDFNHKIQNVFSDNPEEAKYYISPIDCSDEDHINWWQGLVYEGNPIPISTTELRTERGELVRSKSELNIANALHKAGIPYKYECPLILCDGRIIYPDFTILDVRRRRLMYWEHRGLMDDREYSKNAVRKMKDYIKNEITTGDNLIITEETSTNPLGTDEINEIINSLLRAMI